MIAIFGNVVANIGKWSVENNGQYSGENFYGPVVTTSKFHKTKLIKVKYVNCKNVKDNITFSILKIVAQLVHDGTTWSVFLTLFDKVRAARNVKL